MGLSSAAAKAGEHLEQLASRMNDVARARRQAAQSASVEALLDAVRRRQAPELIEELRKAVR